jgi:prophage antirepressor-like protein
MTLDLVYKSDSETRAVRVVMLEGNPWFVAADLALVLGYSSAKDAARLVREDERGRHNLPTPSADQEMTIVSESGLFRLIMKSRRPEAEAFQDWVTRDVLPTIRKTGGYTLTPALPEDPISLALVASLETRKDLAKLEQRTSDLEERISNEALRSNEIAKIYDLGQQLGKLIGYPQGWRMFKNRFGLASYRDLPRHQLEDGVQFLELQIKAYSKQERVVSA